MMNYVIKNARAYIDGEFIETDIKVVDGLIYQIGDSLTSELVYDVKNEVVTPGFIDANISGCDYIVVGRPITLDVDPVGVYNEIKNEFIKGEK
jgi:cytosine/adenosine deaminase-related metal-dependent hydrolase